MDTLKAGFHDQGTINIWDWVIFVTGSCSWITGCFTAFLEARSTLALTSGDYKMALDTGDLAPDQSSKERRTFTECFAVFRVADTVEHQRL